MQYKTMTYGYNLIQKVTPKLIKIFWLYRKMYWEQRAVRKGKYSLWREALQNKA